MFPKRSCLRSTECPLTQSRAVTSFSLVLRTVWPGVSTRWTALSQQYQHNVTLTISALCCFYHLFKPITLSLLKPLTSCARCKFLTLWCFTVWHSQCKSVNRCTPTWQHNCTQIRIRISCFLWNSLVNYFTKWGNQTLSTARHSSSLATGNGYCAGQVWVPEDKISHMAFESEVHTRMFVTGSYLWIPEIKCSHYIDIFNIMLVNSMLFCDIPTKIRTHTVF